MLQDIWTVMWKERKGLFRYRGSRTRFLLVLLSPLLLATVFPLQAGADWGDGPLPVLLAAVVPIVLVGITVPDSFAGERERHTLDTLLASRLPDRAILIGKLAVSIAFAWGITLLFLLVGLITVNVAFWGDGRLLLLSPATAVGSVGLSLLMSVLLASTGVLVSMRAATVQEAAQTLMAIFLVPPMALQAVALLFRDQLYGFLRAIDGRRFLLALMAVLALLAVGVTTAATARFRRSRLVV
jgi:ABC-2 type transport system permease protein